MRAILRKRQAAADLRKLSALDAGQQAGKRLGGLRYCKKHLLSASSEMETRRLQGASLYGPILEHKGMQNGSFRSKGVSRNTGKRKQAGLRLDGSGYPVGGSMNKVIAVDFDGTLCVSQWPEIGEANGGLIEWLKDCRRNGDKLILFTCREGKLLENALKWCEVRGLEFDAVNNNLPETVNRYGDNPRKVSADIYLDDRAIGVFYPPKQSDFYVQGTQGMFMRAAVELNTQNVETNGGNSAARRYSEEKKPEIVVRTMNKLPPEASAGYQYHPPKEPLSWRVRKAWRVLRGRKA